MRRVIYLSVLAAFSLFHAQAARSQILWTSGTSSKTTTTILYQVFAPTKTGGEVQGQDPQMLQGQDPQMIQYNSGSIYMGQDPQMLKSPTIYMGQDPQM